GRALGGRGGGGAFLHSPPRAVPCSARGGGAALRGGGESRRLPLVPRGHPQGPVAKHPRHWTKRERPRLYGDGGQEPKDRACLGLLRQRAPTPATRRPSGLIQSRRR